MTHAAPSIDLATTLLKERPQAAAPDSAQTNPLAVRVLERFESVGIEYCVLRGGDQLADDEVDVLISPHQLSRLRSCLADEGFVELRAPGHAPHHFFVIYDPQQDRWLKLDVVTQIAYGRGSHCWRTALAENCLRFRHRPARVYVPRPEDELVSLLLHCVLDKHTFSTHWRQRLARLCEDLNDERYTDELLAHYWPRDLDLTTLRAVIAQDSWESLLADRPALGRKLAALHSGSWWRAARDHTLRKLARLRRLVRPQALGVALLAPDGAGKSTLAEGISERFFFPVEQIYMGLYQRREKRGWLPGWGLARKLGCQWTRYARSRLLRARGRFVIFDRYTYDALLPAPYRLSRLQRLRRRLLSGCCPAPDLILLLDAPAELLFARKGEHDVAYLARHRQAYRDLQSRFPQMRLIDASAEADRVRRQAIAHIWDTFVERFAQDRKPKVQLAGHATPSQSTQELKP